MGSLKYLWLTNYYKLNFVLFAQISRIRMFQLVKSAMLRNNNTATMNDKSNDFAESEI
jgi:hypothetical protein